VRRRVEIILENAKEEEISAAKRCAPTMEGFVRFLAIEQLYRGMGEKEVARLSDRSVKTIKRWIIAFNARGIDGVAIKGKSGRPRIIPKDKFAEEIIPLVLEPGKINETHWTAIKLHGYLVADLKIALSYTTVINYLHEQNLKLLYPRRWPERQDPEQRAQFVEKLKELSRKPDIELWFSDECGVEGDPRIRRIWAKKGSKPTTPFYGDHIRYHVVGAVSPEQGKFFSLVVPHSDKEVFQVFLDQLATHTKDTKKKIVIVLDNASWHKGTNLNWHHLAPCFLPPYSPDLNPIEIFWKCLKDKYFTNWVARSVDHLIERLCFALRSFTENPNTISSITSINHLIK
jgi:transposase